MNKIPSRADLLALIGRLASAQPSSSECPEGLEGMTVEDLQSLAVSFYESADDSQLASDDIELCRALSTATAPASPHPSVQAQAPASLLPTPRTTPGGRKAPAEVVVEKIAAKPRPEKTPPELKKVESTIIKENVYTLKTQVILPFNTFLREQDKKGLLPKGYAREWRLSPGVEDLKFQDVLNECAYVLDAFSFDHSERIPLPERLETFRRSCNPVLCLHVPLEFIDNHLHELTGNEAKVLIAIWRFIPVRGGSSYAFPSMETLAKKAGVGAENVRKLLRVLEKKGFLRKERAHWFNRDTSQWGGSGNRLYPFWSPE